MKLTCNTEELKYLLRYGLGAIDPKSITNLDCFQLLAKDGLLYVKATDGKLDIEGQMAIQAEGSFQFLVKAKLFNNIIQVLSAPEVILDIQEEKNKLRIISGTAKFNLEFYLNEYPTINKLEEGRVLQVNAKEFKSKIEQTSFSAMKENTDTGILTVYNGLYLETEDKGLYLCGADNSRIAIAHMDLSDLPEVPETSISIPLKILNMFCKLVKDDESTVKLVYNNQFLSLYYDTFVMSTTLLSGKYMNFRSIYLTDWFCDLKMNRQDLLQAIQRISLIAERPDDIRQIKVEYQQDQQLTLSSDLAVAQAKEVVACEGSSSEEFDFWYSPFFLMDVLKLSIADTVELRITKSTATALTFVGADNYYLILPIRSSGASR